jgi:hypothetical protein
MLLKVNKHPIGETSPNLVTLIATLSQLTLLEKSREEFIV